MVTDVVLLDKDLVEIPCRCKDCKYVEWFDDAILEHRHYFCELANHQLVDADGYCYKGERKCDNDL